MLKTVPQNSTIPQANVPPYRKVEWLDALEKAVDKDPCSPAYWMA
jgi:hypothetical protein